MHCIIYSICYAFYVIWVFILTLKLVGEGTSDRQIDRPTDRQTDQTENHKDLKIWNTSDVFCLLYLARQLVSSYAEVFVHPHFKVLENICTNIPQYIDISLIVTICRRWRSHTFTLKRQHLYVLNMMARIMGRGRDLSSKS